MSIDQYGGVCPHCTKTMIQIYHSSSHGHNCEACPNCGFAYGTGVRSEDEDINIVSEFTSKEIWDIMAGMHDDLDILNGTESEREIQIKLRDALDLGGKTPNSLYPSIFDYRANFDTSPGYDEAWKLFERR